MSIPLVSLFGRAMTVILPALLLLANPARLIGADETNAVAQPEATLTDTEVLRSYLQLQDQLRSTQQALERNRQEAEAAATANARAVADRLNAIEKSLEARRDREIEALQATNRFMMTVAGLLAVLGLAVLLWTAYLQWRTMSRLAEFTARLPATRPALPAGDETRLITGTAAADANTRLFSALDRIEKHILELEHTTGQIVPAETASTESQTREQDAATTTAGGNGDGKKADAVAGLLAKGQQLLTQEKAVEALTSFDEILASVPNHAEALVKKAAALEQLNRLDEAMTCYDRAIQADESLTIAYLQKGALFNRLERYDEALRCYEQALRTQEKSDS